MQPVKELPSEPGTKKSPVSERTSSRSLRPTPIQALALFGFGVLLSLLLIEVGLRIFTKTTHENRIVSDRPKTFILPSHVRSERGELYSLIKPNNTFRIAVIGDSFTFGVGLQDDDTFSKRLERILALNHTSRRVEVLNFGIPGLSSSQEVAVLRKVIDYRPDFVLVQMTLNDPELQPYRVAQHGSRAGVHPSFFSSLFSVWTSLQFVSARIANARSHSVYESYYRELFDNPESWETFVDAYRTIQEMSAKFGVRVGVVVFPLFSHPLDDRYPFLDIHKKIRLMLQSQGLAFVDLLKPYRKMDNERLQIVPGNDSHPNEIAHRIAAEEIFQWLKRSALIPPELTAVTVSGHRDGDPRSLLRALKLR